MAIDSRQKRFSMMNFVSGSAIHLDNLFEADGTVDLDDRQHLLDCYSGIAFEGAADLDIHRGLSRIGYGSPVLGGLHSIGADILGKSPLSYGLLHYWDLGGTSDIGDNVGSWDLTNNSCTTATGGAPDGGDCIAMTATQYLDRASIGPDMRGPLTFACWFYMTAIASSGNWIYNHRDTGDLSSQFSYANSATDETRGWLSTNGSSWTGQATWANNLSLNTWYYLLVTYDLNNINLYVDDTLRAGPVSMTGMLNGANAAVAFGTSSWSKGDSAFGHAGRLFSCGMWNRVLNAEDRTLLYNSGSGRRFSDLSDL